jgi:hypothetical protein
MTLRRCVVLVHSPKIERPISHEPAAALLRILSTLRQRRAQAARRRRRTTTACRSCHRLRPS